MKILVVEDDQILADGIKKALTYHGYRVDILTNGLDVKQRLLNFTYDLLLLDLSLPGKDGLDILSDIRSNKEPLPILILTARDTVNDRIQGLDKGADDYLVKPFDLLELEARVRALLRRGQRTDYSSEINLGNIRFDLLAQRLYVGDKPMDLSVKEYSILEMLIKNMGRVISKELLIEYVYGLPEEVNPNTLEVAIHRLRKKLSPEGFNLRTIRGLGYLLEKVV